MSLQIVNIQKTSAMAVLLILLYSSTKINAQSSLTYPIVDTDQHIYYDTLVEISALAPGEEFYGQDACYTGFEPSYQDNGNGTITDLITQYFWGTLQVQCTVHHIAYVGCSMYISYSTELVYKYPC